MEYSYIDRYVGCNVLMKGSPCRRGQIAKFEMHSAPMYLGPKRI